MSILHEPTIIHRVSLKSHLIVIALSLVRSTATILLRSPVENMFINWYMNRVWLLYWNGHMLFHSYWHQLFHGHWYDFLYRIRHLLLDWNRDGPHDRYGDGLGNWNLNRIGLSNSYCYWMRHGNCHGLCHWNSYIFQGKIMIYCMIFPSY